ncbi:hypothetical protein PVAP13_5KG121500 [Panicum virgatum]|uniref:SIAH-type domain-containing protein n=1 Tax=Panicum virgatum TaxID=38727 RepID=A0A8T0SF02_PANVG|nr:hypothetical protein PVAP13_5KG121500 [Panicum virgatum]
MANEQHKRGSLLGSGELPLPEGERRGEELEEGEAAGQGGGATYAAADASVLDAKLPCPFQEHGCASCVAYDHASDHERACPWAPCHCPDPGCGAFPSPARLLDHFRADHPSWPVTDVSYGEPHRIPVPRPPQGLHVLVGEGDRCVFLVSSSARLLATCVSVVCARANGDAAAGVAQAQFDCTLRVEATGGSKTQDHGGDARVPGGEQQSVPRLLGGGAWHVPGGPAEDGAGRLRRGSPPDGSHRQT